VAVDEQGTLVEQGAAPGLTRSWPAIVDAVGAIRRVVLDFAREAGGGQRALEHIGLAASEAVTNSVLHAYREDDAPGKVTIVGMIRGRDLRLDVVDDGCGMRPRIDSPGLGLGLPLIAQLAEEVEIVDEPGGGTRVKMRFALDRR
jgi:serine/threonine-protein kinase RsbW